MSGETPADDRGSDGRAERREKRTEPKGRSEAGPYDPTRYGAVSVAVWQLLPNSNAKTLGIAFALGVSLHPNGSSDTVRTGKQIPACVINKHRLPDVLEALGNPDPSQWRRYVRDWEARGVAHHCAPGTVCLFRMPFLAECPNCGADLVGVELERAQPRKARGPGFSARGGSTPAEESGAIIPPRGRNAPVPRNKHSRGPEQELPRSSTVAPHRDSGINGMAVGTRGSEPSEEATVPAASAVEELPRGRPQETAAGELERISPFDDKSCPECGCWPHQGDHFAGCSHRTTIRGVSA